MKKIAIYSIIILVLFLFHSCSVSSYDRKAKKASKLAESRLETITEQQENIKKLESDKKKIEDQIKKLKSEEKDDNSDKISELEEEVEKLENKIETLEEENSTLKSSKTSQNYGSYIAIKFWQDGKNYHLELGEEDRVYSDPNLSKEVSKDSIIVSPTISDDYIESGQTVYTVLSTKGLVYMSSCPSLSEIEGSHQVASSEAIGEKASKKYLSIIFWKGSERKKLYSDSNQVWYTDPFLSNELEDSKDFVITSYNIDDFKMKSGVPVYSASDEDGNIVWMFENPSLETIE